MIYPVALFNVPLESKALGTNDENSDNFHITKVCLLLVEVKAVLYHFKKAEK